MAVNVIIHGALGRMGKEIARIVFADAEITCVGALEFPQHPAMGTDIGDHLGIGKTGVELCSSLHDISQQRAVIIDFTTPAATQLLLNEIKGNDARIVIGTTGFTEKDMALMKDVSKNNAVLFSPNMSLGVNFLFYLTQIAAEKLGSNFDIEVIETHHRFKKDAPSGTAKRLGEIAAAALGCSYADAIKHGRSGMTGERSAKEVGMHAVRGGDIVGEHSVLFAGIGERLELKHYAHSRANFAQGAVTAAKWLDSKKQGLYSMRDILDF